MNTRVIILAQGEQRRLPDLTVAKQMLPLPACGNVPILHRTLRQLAAFAPLPDDGILVAHVITWEPLATDLMGFQLPTPSPSWLLCTTTLEKPGNSSLRGMAQVTALPGGGSSPSRERTIVLLGDVVYSWACLRALFDPVVTFRFVGTSDLSRSDGELWGVAWHPEVNLQMRWGLKEALSHHPPFAAYQPGQLRRWLWAMTLPGWPPPSGYVPLDEVARKAPWYRAVDDYTRDIDIMEHVEALPALSELAAADDREHFVLW